MLEYKPIVEITDIAKKIILKNKKQKKYSYKKWYNIAFDESLKYDGDYVKAKKNALYAREMHKLLYNDFKTEFKNRKKYKTFINYSDMGEYYCYIEFDTKKDNNTNYHNSYDFDSDLNNNGTYWHTSDDL